MQRKFLVNLAFLLFLNVLVKPFYILGIDAEVQERVGPDVYGLYFALFGLSVMLNIFLDLGINNFNTRNIAQHRQLLTKHLSGILSVRILLVVLYAVVAFGSALALGYRGQELYLLAWLVFNQALIAYIMFMRSNLAGLHLFKQDSLISVLDRTLLIAIMGYVLWSDRFSGQELQIEWFVYAQSIAYGVSAIVVTAMVLKRTTFKGVNFNLPFAVMIVKRSMPFALLILLMSLYYRSDSIMIERLLEDGKFQAGVYAQAFRFMEALNMIAYLFAGLLLPIFSRMLKERADVSGLLWLAIRLLLGGAIGVAILSSFYGTEIMALRYSEYTELSGPAFTLLMWSFVLMSVSYMTGTLLTAQGNLGFLNRLSAAGMLLNICLNFLVIPIWYAYGAALTSLITQGLIMVIQIVYLLRTRLIHVELKLLMRILLFIGGGVALVALIPQGSMSNGLLLLILAACMGLWAFLSGMIDIRGIVRLLRERQNAELSENERFA